MSFPNQLPHAPQTPWPSTFRPDSNLRKPSRKESRMSNSCLLSFKEPPRRTRTRWRPPEQPVHCTRHGASSWASPHLDFLRYRACGNTSTSLGKWASYEIYGTLGTAPGAQEPLHQWQLLSCRGRMWAEKTFLACRDLIKKSYIYIYIYITIVKL